MTVGEKRPCVLRITGSTGISQVGLFSGFQGTINNIDKLIVESHDFNFTYSPQHIVTTNITSVNSLQEIFAEIDKSNSSAEDKDKIKRTLSKLQGSNVITGAIFTKFTGATTKT